MTDDEKELKDQRVVTMMSPSELEAIDDWMFKNRIRSRGEAIRRLCHVGMEYDRVGWSLLRAGMDRAGKVTRAAKSLSTVLADETRSRLEVRAEGLETAVAGAHAVMDLLARIGTVWISTTTIKAPDDIKEAISLARKLRDDLEREGQTDAEKLENVTEILRAFGVLTADATEDRKNGGTDE